MFETQRGRGIFLAVVAFALLVVVGAADFVSERKADDRGEAAARMLATELSSYESLVDVQVAMQSGDLSLPVGASLGTDELRVVAWQEVRTLLAVRCARVIASASEVSAPLEVGEPSVEDRPCGR